MDQQLIDDSNGPQFQAAGGEFTMFHNNTGGVHCSSGDLKAIAGRMDAWPFNAEAKGCLSFLRQRSGPTSRRSPALPSGNGNMSSLSKYCSLCDCWTVTMVLGNLHSQTQLAGRSVIQIANRIAQINNIYV